MLTKMRKTMTEDESGQALVVGAFTMLILAFSAMVTFQLGHAINERMKVQNAADNGAFSVAAVVARSLNFIAFVNRTMIVHYVSMMAFTAISSMFTALHGMVGMLGDLLMTIAAIACSIASVCQLCVGVPILGIACAICVGIFRAIQIIAQPIGTALTQTAANVLKPLDERTDPIIAAIVDNGSPISIAALNYYGMYGAQVAMKTLTTGALGLIAVPGSTNFQKKVMDETAGGPNILNTNTTGTIYNGMMGVLNAADSYNGMFDNGGADGIPEGGTFYRTSRREADSGEGQAARRIRADRLMTEITNGSRTGNRGNSRVTWESDRHLLGNGMLADAAGFLGLKHAGSSRVTLPQGQNPFKEDGPGRAVGGSGASGSCQRAQQGCQDAQRPCETAESNFQAKERTCQTRTGECSACTGGGTPPASCPACSSAESACRERDTARNNRDSTCERSKEKCEKVKDECEGASIGGVDTGSLAGQNFAFSSGANNSTLSRGAVYQSAEYVKVTGIGAISGGGSARVFGIQTSSRSGDSFHCRYPGHQKYPVYPGCPQGQYSKPTECKGESHRHKWKGITRYISYKIVDSPSTLFNQPDYWGFANMDPAKAKVNAGLGLGFGRGDGNFSVTAGGKTGRVEGVNQPGISASMLPGGVLTGLNAWSRSQVYYHRPGAWSEPPNLFNPFWRAKLAPLGPKAANLMNRIGLGGIPGMDTLVNQLLVH